jgi:hypothetical protein
MSDNFDFERDMTPNMGEPANPRRTVGPKKDPGETARAKIAASTVTKEPPTNWKELEEDIQSFYQMAATVIAFRDPSLGGLINQQSKVIAEAWVDLCKRSDRWRRFWVTVNAGGGYGKVLFAHLPIFFYLVNQVNNPRQGAHFGTDDGPGIADLFEGLQGAETS